MANEQKIRCPKCGSADVEVKKGGGEVAKFVVSVPIYYVLLPLGLGKSFMNTVFKDECKKCGHEFGTFGER